MPRQPPTWEQRYYRCNKQRAYAWAKYYEDVLNHHNGDYRHYEVIVRTMNDDAIPIHIKNEFMEMATALKKEWECPICLEMIKPDNLEITPCGHYYCKPCITNMKQIQGNDCKCAICRRKIAVNGD